jgi:hypothetical protein
MPIQIEVQDVHAQLLVDFYVQRLKILRDEIIEREREAKEINTVIQKLRKKDGLLELPTSQTHKMPYSDKWTWVKKVQFAIEHEDRPLTTKEIVDVLTEYETTFLFDRKRAVASISSVLSSKSGADKEFSRIESDSGDFAYAINKASTPGEDFDSPF